MEHVPRQQYAKEFREQAVQLVLEQHVPIEGRDRPPGASAWYSLPAVAGARATRSS